MSGGGRNESYLTAQPQPPPQKESTEIPVYTQVEWVSKYDDWRRNGSSGPMPRETAGNGFMERARNGLKPVTMEWQETTVVVLNEVLSIIFLSILIGAGLASPVPIIASALGQAALIGGMVTYYFLWGGVHFNSMVTIGVAFHQPVAIPKQEMKVLRASQSGKFKALILVKDENTGEVKKQKVLWTRGSSENGSNPEFWNEVDENAKAIVTGRNYFAMWTAVIRIIAQVAGWFIGSACLFLIVADGQMSAAACVVDPYNSHNWSAFNAFFVEMIGTFILVTTTVMATSMQLPIGLVGVGVSLINMGVIISFLHISSACFNPVRALAINAVSNTWNPFVSGSAWVYFVGPPVGCILAILHMYLVKWLRGRARAGFMCLPLDYNLAGITYAPCTTEGPEPDYHPIQKYGIMHPTDSASCKYKRQN